MNKLKTLVGKYKVLVVAIVMLLSIAICLGVSAAYYQGTKSGEASLTFEEGILFNVTNIDKTAYQYVNNNSLLYYPEENSDVTEKLSVPVLSGTSVDVAAPQLQVQNETVAFNARAKLNYIYYIVGAGGSYQQVDADYFNTTDVALEQELFSAPLSFSERWVKDAGSDYYYYSSSASTYATQGGLQSITGAQNIDFFANSNNLTMQFNTFDSAPNGIAKIEISLQLEVIETTNLDWEILDVLMLSDVTYTLDETNSTITLTQNTSSKTKYVILPEYEAEATAAASTLSASTYATTKKYKTVAVQGTETTPFDKNAIKVQFPNTLTTIGAYSFAGNSNLKEFNYSKKLTTIGAYAFSSCYQITSAHLPNTVTTIGEAAFQVCTGIKEVTIPKSVTSMGDSVFYYCINILDVTLEEGLTVLSASCFRSCSALQEITIPSTVTTMGNYLFLSCTSLESVTFNDGLLSIGTQAFQGCTKLNNVEMPNSVTAIGQYTFQSCTSLDTIDLSDNLNSIGYGAFIGCTALTSIAIPEGVTTFPQKIFENCSNLETVTWSSKLTEVGGEAFSGCTKLTGISFPNTISSIASSAFKNCTSLTTFTINSRASIYAEAFSGCTGLTSVNLNSAYNIHDKAFSGCTGLTTILLPSDINMLGANVFENCTGLLEVFVERTTIPPAGTGATIFSGCTKLSAIWVPNGSEEAYRSATNWITYKDLINPIGFKNGTEGVVYTPITSTGSKTTEGAANHVAYMVGTDVAMTYANGYTGTDTVVYIKATHNGKPVTHIGTYAFSKTNVIKVVMPNTITTMRSFIFFDCTSLTSLTIPASVTAISAPIIPGCTSVTSISVAAGNSTYHSTNNCIIQTESKTLVQGIKGCTIPTDGSVTTIGWYAFNRLTNLTSITIPSTITYLDAYAFCGTGLTSVVIPNSVTNMSNSVFENCLSLSSVTLSTGLSYVGSYAFSGCTNLKTITIPTNITQIYNSSFAYSGLTSITIPNSITKIHNSAFEGCTGLTNVTIPATVTTIGDKAFKGCTSLKYVNVNRPSSSTITSAGTTIFDGCTALTAIYVDADSYSTYVAAENWETYKDIIYALGTPGINYYPCDGNGNLVTEGAANHVGYAVGNETNGSGYSGSATVLTIQASYKGLPVHHISSNAFRGNTIITQVILPNHDMVVDSYAFYGCSKLASITLPTSLTVGMIGYNAFENCTSLTSITLPEATGEGAMFMVGESAFNFCSGLKSIHIGANTLIFGDAFIGCSGVTSVTSNSVNYKVVENFLVVQTDVSKPALDVMLYFGAGGSVTVPEDAQTLQPGAFYGRTAVTDVVIPENVNYIGSQAFYGCTGLIQVIVARPSSLSVATLNHTDAFEGCTSLQHIFVDGDSLNSYKTASNWSTYANIIYPITVGLVMTPVTSSGAVTTYGAADHVAYMVGDNSDTRGNAYPSGSATKIHLPTVYMGKPVTHIGKRAFQNKSQFVGELTIPEGYIGITETAAFAGLSITSIHFAASLTTIHSATIMNCKNLETITIGDSNATYKVVNNCLIKGSQLVLGCKTSVIPIDGTIKSIAKYAFHGHTGLTSVILPNEITSIGNSAFSGCTGLTYITLPSSLTTIGTNVFQGCTGLTSIIIPKTVTSIGANAFNNCTNLKEVALVRPTGSTITSLGASAFANCTALESIYTPFDSLSAYQAGTNWSTYSSKIKLFDTSVFVFTPTNSSGTAVTEGADTHTHYIIGTGTTTSGNGYTGAGGLVYIPNTYNGKPVLGVGQYAFRNNTTITEVIISEGIKNIGAYAFYGCNGVKTLVLNTDLTSIAGYAFYKLTSITNLTIPSSLVTINNYAFGYNDNVKALTLTSGLTLLGSHMFYNCTGLEYIKLPASITTPSTYVFYSCKGLKTINFEDGFTTIGSYMFWNCTGLEYLEIPSWVTTINSYAFQGCNGITTLKLNEGLTTIADAAFGGCTSLASINIPASVTTIGANPFRSYGQAVTITVTTGNANYVVSGNCLINRSTSAIISGFINSTIPTSGVTTIGNTAFGGISTLTTITIPSNIVTIDTAAFSSSGLTSITIPGTVKTIGNSAFYTCTKLTSLTLNNGITTIGDGAFYQCFNLTSVNIPGSVTTINQQAFYGCVGVTSLTLNEGLESIGSLAFAAMLNLTSVNIPSTVTTITVSATGSLIGTPFAYCPNLTTLTATHVSGSTYVALNNCLIKVNSSPYVLTIGCAGSVIPTMSNLRIGPFAFACTPISSITIPSKVNYIHQGAFYQCANLLDIVFEGATPPTLQSATNLFSVRPTMWVPSANRSAYISKYTSLMGGTSYANTYILANAAVSGVVYTPVTADGTVTTEGAENHAGYMIGNNSTTAGNGYTGTATTVKIAPYYNGKPILAIGKYAFANNTTLTSITIPATVKIIDTYAFSGCTGLKQFIIPGSVETIKDYAFANCTALTNVQLWQSGGFYYYNTSIKASTIPMIKITSANVFDGCTALTKIYTFSSFDTTRYRADPIWALLGTKVNHI